MKTLSDSDSGARVTSRECFWSFHAHFPERAASLLKDRVDASTRRRIEKANRNGVLVAIPPERKAPAHRERAHCSRSTKKSKEKQKTVRDGENRHGGAILAMPTPTPAAPPTPAPAPSLSYSPAVALSAGPARVAAANHSSAAFHTSTASRGASVGLGDAPSRVLYRSADFSDAPLRGAAVSAPLQNANAMLSNSTSAMRGGATRVVVPAPKAAASAKSSAGGASATVSSSSRRGVIEVASRVYSSKQSQSLGSVSFKDAWRLGKHSVWSKRVECYGQMQARLSSQDASLSGAQAKKLAELLCSEDRGVSDPHFKVCHGALQTAFLLVQGHHDAIVPYLDRFLPSVLSQLGETKRQIKTEANKVLNEVRRKVHAETIVAVLSKVMVLTGEKFRIGCTEFMMQLVPESGPFFSNSLNVRHVLKCAGKMYTKKKSALSKSAGMLLGAIFKLNRGSFVAQFRTLNEKEQDRLYPLLSAMLPQFASEMKGEQPARSSSDGRKRAEDQATNRKPEPKSKPASEPAETSDPHKATFPGAFAAHMRVPVAADTTADAVARALSGVMPPRKTASPASFAAKIIENGRGAAASPMSTNTSPSREASPVPAQNSGNIGFSSMGAGRMNMGSGRDEPRKSPSKSPPEREISETAAMPVASTPVILRPFEAVPASATKRLFTPHAPPLGMTPRSALASIGGLGPFASPSLIVEKCGELAWSPSQLVITGGAMPPESEVMAALVRDFSSDESQIRTSALEVAALWIRKSEASLSASFAQQLLLNSIDFLRDSCPHLRERALSVIRELASKYSEHVSNSLETVLRRLFVCFEKNEGSVMYGSAKTLAFLASKIEPMRYSQVLVPYIKQEFTQKNAKSLCQALKLLSVVLERMPSSQTLACLESFVGFVKDAMGFSGAPEVRRAAVMCFVALDCMLGDNFRPYMDILSPAQSKLVTIYVRRRRKREAESA